MTAQLVKVWVEDNWRHLAVNGRFIATLTEKPKEEQELGPVMFREELRNFIIQNWDSPDEKFNSITAKEIGC